MSRSKLWTGLTAVCATLLAFFVGGTAIAGQYEGAINNFLNVETTQVVQTGDETEDTEYFKSDFGAKNEANAKKLVEAGFDQTIQEEIEGAALLMNKNGALPLSKSERISFFGHASVDPIHKGSSAGVDPMDGYRINFPDAMRMNGFTLNEELVAALEASPTTRAKSNYFWMDCTNATQGIADGEDPISYYTPELRETWESERGGTAIMVLTRCGQENYDMLLDNVTGFVKGDLTFDPPKYTRDKTGRSSLALIDEEIAILEMIKEAKDAGYFDKFVVLLNTGNVMEVNWLEEYGVDARVFTGLIGGVGALGTAQLLSGEANFSGKLVDTYAYDSLSAPALVNANENSRIYTNGDEVEAAVIGTQSPFADTGRYFTFQAEGIYVGYKYYETRYEDYILGRGNADSTAGARSGMSEWNYTNEVSYPFGYGLSYTTFEQMLGDVRYNAETDKFEVDVTVTNTGDVAGKSVVQLYAQTPYGDYERENLVEKSAIQLVGFDKTELLAPGQSEELTVEAERYLLASYDYTNAKTYILSEGDYYLAIGDDAHDAINNVIRAKAPDADGLVNVDGTPAQGDADKVYHFSYDKLDDKTYSVTETGVNVTNRFDDCDINYWLEGTGTYLSRQDWEGTYPQPLTNVRATDEMIEVLAGHNYTKPEGAPTVAEATEGFGTPSGLKLVDMRNVSYDGSAADEELWDKFIEQLSLDEMLNVLDDAQSNSWAANETIAAPAMKLGDGVDGPNGTSIGFPYEDTTGKYGSGKVENASMCCFTGKAVLTGTFNRDLYTERGRLIGEFGLWGGKQMFWTLGVNYHKTPFGGRNFEYCSEDANLSYMALVPEAIAMEEKGVVCSAKHAAGNDQETIRIGVATFFNEQGWREGSLRASEGALRVAKIKSYMQSYQRQGLESCMNKDAFNIDVCMYEWGFRGYAITDCTNARLDGYQGDYIDQIVSGTDGFCMTNDQIAKQTVLDYLDATDDGALVEHIKQAAKDYYYMLSRSNGINGFSSNTEIVTLTPWWQTALNSCIAVFSVLTAAGLVLLTVTLIRNKKREGK